MGLAGEEVGVSAHLRERGDEQHPARDRVRRAPVAAVSGRESDRPPVTSVRLRLLAARALVKEKGCAENPTGIGKIAF